MKVKELLEILPQSTDIIIRGAFQSGWGKDESRPNYYKGKIAHIPQEFKYKNKPIVFLWWWGETGDQCEIKGSNAVDIAVGDLDEVGNERN